MAINPPITTLNYGFVITKKKQIKALYEALIAWRNTLEAEPTSDTASESGSTTSSSPSTESTSENTANNSEVERWEDPKGFYYRSTKEETSHWDEYNLVEHFLHISGYGEDIAQIEVKGDPFNPWAQDRDLKDDDDNDGEGLKGVGIVYFPDDHKEKLVREDVIGEDCDYTAMEFAALDADYLKKAIGRLEEFLNDPVIKGAKLSVRLGMVSSMNVIIGR
ncbi:hypothetical protein BDN72DRAFT_844829 [Pluteus cervinus]|uniref:Uncharacterized protein n=1 Tax=Pluteus cervinus TaxID=181527 RepID=A0ACD3AJL0_9AGAR|nr:hypothetical protein BDN72DRAFT_844829 [Pluteus cervinus]